MFRKLIASLLAAGIALSVSSCSVEKDFTSDKETAVSTTKETRIHNNFKDVLPDFNFDSKPVEKYDEGLSYTFSAECSERDFDKYIKAIRKTGFENRVAEGNGYFSAYNEEDYYVEITLVDGLITVFIKRT